MLSCQADMYSVKLGTGHEKVKVYIPRKWRVRSLNALYPFVVLTTRSCFIHIMPIRHAQLFMSTPPLAL